MRTETAIVAGLLVQIRPFNNLCRPRYVEMGAKLFLFTKHLAIETGEDVEIVELCLSELANFSCRTSGHPHLISPADELSTILQKARAWIVANAETYMELRYAAVRVARERVENV